MISKVRECVSSCELFINSPDNLYIHGKFKEDLIKSLKNITSHIMILNDDNINDLNDIKNTEACVEISLKRLVDLFLEREISPNIKDFISNYVLLTYNWTNNVFTSENSDLLGLISLVDRIYKQHFTIIEAIEILRKLIRRNQMIIESQEPSVGLSKAYLEVIGKDNNEKNILS